jgi:hypothetical protein
MRLLLAMVTIGVLGTGVPASAGSLRVTEFKVSASGRVITFAANVCGTKGDRVDFQGQVRPVGGGHRTTSSYAHGTLRYSCTSQTG